jgi:hypothetical protein
MGIKWSHSHPGCLSPGKEIWYPLEDSMGPIARLDIWPGFETWIIQPLAYLLYQLCYPSILDLHWHDKTSTGIKITSPCTTSLPGPMFQQEFITQTSHVG